MMNPRSLLLGCDLIPRHRPLVPGRIHAFGPYFPKSSAMHWDSSWSQMVLDVKHGDEWTTTQAGRVIAGHLNFWLQPETPYVITFVPGAPGRSNWPAAHRLAKAIHSHLGPPQNVAFKRLLELIYPKARQQHECRSPEERAANVRDRYAFCGWCETPPAPILLVDDIVTSGATLSECARVLDIATAQPVIALAMARTVQR